jgi:hypothetical protein
MTAGTICERRQERQRLLQKIREDPTRDWTQERRRIAELQRSLAFHETVHP